jgi:hypothetical protein
MIMKKWIAAAALAAALTAGASTAMAFHWVPVGDLQGVTYDTTSVSRQGNIAAATVRKENKDGSVSEYNYMFNLNNQTYTLASKVNYDQDGNVKSIETYREDEFGWVKVKKNSAEALVYDALGGK